MDLIKLLTSNSLLVVGDGDQSIYSWKGAYAESMTDFANEFSKTMSDDGDNDDDNMKKKLIQFILWKIIGKTRLFSFSFSFSTTLFWDDE